MSLGIYSKKASRFHAADTIVVGAGIGGLLLAHRLFERGESVLVLEKSKGLGGRIASRRIANKIFDHGIPWLSTNQLGMIPHLEKESFFHCVSKSGNVAAGSGLTAFAKHLGQRIKVIRECQVEKLRINQGGSLWELSTSANLSFQASRAVLAMPAPQALALLESSFPRQLSSVKTKLEAVAYHPQLVVLGTTQVPLKRNSVKDSVIERIVDNGAKGIIGSRGALTIYLSHAVSEELFPEDDDKILRFVKELLGNRFKIELEGAQLKRWRYAIPSSVLTVSFLIAETSPSLFLTGDYFTPGSLDGSLFSARALSHYLATETVQPRKHSQLRHFGYK